MTDSEITSALKIFGANVRGFREQQGLTQEQLASKAGIHRSYLGGVERGQRRLCIENIVRLSGALSVPIARLFMSNFEWERINNGTFADDATHSDR